MTADRALFDRLPRLSDLVPFVPLADGLPTPVERVADGLWVKRDDRTSSVYGGNKVRKFEFVLPVAQRRGGPVVTAGGIGSHHVVAAAIYGTQLDLDVHAVLYPQPVTTDVERTQLDVRRLGVTVTKVPNPYLMPFGVAALMARLSTRRPYLLWPGASTPLGTLGYVSAGLELVGSGIDPPDVVVVPLGSGGTAVGMALGLAVGGWLDTTVLAVRAADSTVTNAAVLEALAGATVALLAVGGWRPVRHRLEIVTSYLGRGYGAPTDAGQRAQRRAAAFGLELEPTYSAKAFACALDQVAQGQSTVFVNTFAGSNYSDR